MSSFTEDPIVCGFTVFDKVWLGLTGLLAWFFLTFRVDRSPARKATENLLLYFVECLRGRDWSAELRALQESTYPFSKWSRRAPTLTVWPASHEAANSWPSWKLTTRRPCPCSSIWPHSKRRSSLSTRPSKSPTAVSTPSSTVRSWGRQSVSKDFFSLEIRFYFNLDLILLLDYTQIWVRYENDLFFEFRTWALHYDWIRNRSFSQMKESSSFFPQSSFRASIARCPTSFPSWTKWSAKSFTGWKWTASGLLRSLPDDPLFFSRCRLKKIQDKKQIARGKVEAARAARRLQQDVPDVANMVEEEIDEDIVI